MRQSGACVGHQNGKEVEFAWRKMNLVSAAPKQPAFKIDFEIPHTQQSGWGNGLNVGASQQRPHASYQLAEAKGCGNAIVRAGLEYAQLIFHRAVGAGNNNPEVWRQGSKPAAGICPTVFGHVQVQQSKVEPLSAYQIQCFLTAGRLGENESCGLQRALQQLRQSWVTGDY